KVKSPGTPRWQVDHTKISPLLLKPSIPASKWRYRGTRQELSARITAETQAKRYIFDTLESTIPLLKFLRDNKLITPYYFPTQAKYPDSVKEKGPKGLFYWSIDRESHIGLGY